MCYGSQMKRKHNISTCRLKGSNVSSRKCHNCEHDLKFPIQFLDVKYKIEVMTGSWKKYEAKVYDIHNYCQFMASLNLFFLMNFQCDFPLKIKCTWLSFLLAFNTKKSRFIMSTLEQNLQWKIINNYF